jgi:cystic fibrosis transmembrane conductance regulator
VFKDQSPYREASFLSKILFSWTTPIISKARSGQLHVDDYGYLKDIDKVENLSKRMRRSWKI